ARATSRLATHPSDQLYRAVDSVSALVRNEAIARSVNVWFGASGRHGDLHSFPTRRSSDLPWSFGSAASGTPTTSGSVPSIRVTRSEEHTSELQSRFDLVCRLLLEKKKNSNPEHSPTHSPRTATTPVSDRPATTAASPQHTV